MTLPKLLHSGNILVSDGAMGTALFQRGFSSETCPEKLNSDHPEIIQEIAMEYIHAGSDIIHTNTFGCSPLKLSEYNLDIIAYELNRQAAKILSEIDNDVLVSGSIGPTGKMLFPLGDADPVDVQQGFEIQAKGLIDGGVDMFTIETFTDIQEITMAINACRSLDKTVPIAASMVFNHTPNGNMTMMGVSIYEAIMTLQDLGIDLIGSNCGNGIIEMVDIATTFTSTSTLPVLIQANAGAPVVDGTQVTYPETPDFFSVNMEALLNTGVSMVGGCCGTTPQHISTIRKHVDAFNGKNGN